jgi:DNA-binding transcriptional MerR regulator
VTELVSIGDFSRMTLLTVKALRHYQQVGLLEPARVDSCSGYRYYRPEQVGEARLIRRLRDLDLPVEDVRAVLRAPDEASRNAVLVEHLDRMSRQLAQVQDTVDSLRRMLSGDGDPVEVSRRDETGGPAVVIRGWVDGDSAISWWLEAFTELHRLLRTAGLRRRGPDGAEFPSEWFTEGAAEVRVFVPVDRLPTPSGRVEAVTLPTARHAVARHAGPMVDLDGAYSALGRTVVEQALATDGPIVERYLPVGDPEDLLAHHTEVCWPVR